MCTDKLRKIGIEPFLNFKRFSVKGIPAASDKIGISLTSVNLMKLVKLTRPSHLREQKNSSKKTGHQKFRYYLFYYLGL